jgi:hypothetical protein
MATITPTTEHECTGVLLYTWAGIVSGDTLESVNPLGGFADRSIQIAGIPGAGLTIDVQGSNQRINGTQWAGLRNPGLERFTTLLTTALLADGAIQQILESTQQVVVVLTGGDGTTALTIRLRCEASSRR